MNPPPDVRPPSLPPAPWILIDRTTVEQTADLLELLAEWLAGADPVIRGLRAGLFGEGTPTRSGWPPGSAPSLPISTIALRR